MSEPLCTRLRRDHRPACRRSRRGRPRLADRTTRPTVRGNGRLMIVAADHPARGALAVGIAADRDEQPDRPARPVACRARRPGRRRRARHRRHPRRPAAARGARGQGGVLVVQPRRTGRRVVRARRPDDRRHRRIHRRGEDERRKDAVPHRSRRSRHGRHPGGVRAGRRRAGRPRADRHARAVHVDAGSTARSATTSPPTR